jgi:iron complex transport system substrate-binding protein
LLKRAGVPLLEVDTANDWDAIRRVTREVAAAVGASDRGEALLASMDAELAAIAELRGPQPVRAIGWSGAAEDVPGADTLFNTILATAGGVNLAARATGRSGFDLETVVRLRPQVLLRGTGGSGHALRDGMAGHPALRAVPGITVIDYPEGLWACGVPAAAGYALDLARRLRSLRGEPR